MVVYFLWIVGQYLISLSDKRYSTRYVYLIPGRPKYSASHWAESFLIKKIFHSALCLEKLLLQPFPPYFIWSAVANPLIIFLSLPPPILCHSDFMKSLATARKSFIRSRNLSRSCKRLSKDKAGERLAAAVDQRNLTATVSIADNHHRSG